MPKFQSDQRIRYVFCKMPFLFSVLLMAVAVGCGDGSTQGEPKDAAPGGATTLPGGDAAADGSGTNASSAGQPVPSGDASNPAPTPGAEAGIQLPELDLPDGGAESGDAESTESPGPTRPGDGGIEMPELNSSSQSTTLPQSGTATESDSSIDLQFASWSAIETHAKSTGKITVVDLWSTVCDPCVKEFPGLVRLSKAMPDDVTCIGVSVDYDGRKSRPPESYTEKVGGFLSAFGAEFANYLCNTPSDDVFAAVDLPSIPAVLIYDANGQLIKRFVDAGDTIGFSYDADIIPYVQKIAG